MPKYEQIAIIRATLKNVAILTVPLIEHLFDEVAALAKPENGPGRSSAFRPE